MDSYHNFLRILRQPDTLGIDPTGIRMIKRLTVVVYFVVFVFIGCGEDEDIFENAPREILWKKDSSLMTLILEGRFEMGDHLDNMENSLPVHTVELDAFYMDVYEVTIGQFKEFVNQTRYDFKRWDDVADFSATDDHPIVYVTWADAEAYAKWAGKRLPTEAEWEYAARGGLTNKRYPWGDELLRNNANYAGIEGNDQWDGETSPVGSFLPNGYGIYDMAGNVWEWCADWYGEGYYAASSLENPKGPKVGQYRVLRGGSWSDHKYGLRVAYRYEYDPKVGHYLGGFRCVSDSPEP